MDDNIKNIELENSANKNPHYADLVKYLLCRTLVVFFLKLFLGIILNSYDRIEVFFMDYSFHFGKALLGWSIIAFTIFVSLILFNLIFLVLRVTDYKGKFNYYLIHFGLWKCLKLFFKKFFPILIKNFKYEWSRDANLVLCPNYPINDTILYKYENNPNSLIQTTRKCKLSKHFLVFAIVSLLLFRGNPFLNNYYGIYNKIVVNYTQYDEPIYSNKHWVMIEKKDWNLEKIHWNYFVDDYLWHNYYNWDDLTYNDLGIVNK